MIKIDIEKKRIAVKTSVIKYLCTPPGSDRPVFKSHYIAKKQIKEYTFFLVIHKVKWPKNVLI